MKNITSSFSNFFLPVKALVIYQSQADDRETYVEAADINTRGRMCNLHPLNEEEAAELAASLQTERRTETDFLQPMQLLPDNLLYLLHTPGIALWHTPAQKVNMLFKEALNIPCGEAFIPQLVWLASKRQLSIYALSTNKKPTAKTPLYHAPFFNVRHDGSVCMGTVDIDIPDDSSLEDFMQAWQDYFWNSYFSHTIEDGSRIKGNIVHLWRSQVERQQPFPLDVLVKNNKTVNDLIVSLQNGWL